MPHPASLSCPNRPYRRKSEQKGGTLLVREVMSLSKHYRLICVPDGYRPSCCPACRCPRLHAHGFRGRRLRGDPEVVHIEIRRYRCLRCRAVWQVLPGLLARFIHRRWIVVQSALCSVGVLESSGTEFRVFVPPSTIRRWRKKLQCAATHLTKVRAALRHRFKASLRVAERECTGARTLDILAREGIVDAKDKLAHMAFLLHWAGLGERIM